MIRVTCNCGQSFQIDDEYLGEKFDCTHCGASVTIQGENVSSHDVFISHSTKDKVTADAVCAALESKGLRCWVAPRDIPPGAEWGEAIVEGIELCKAFVVVFSAQSNESKHVMREVERAVNKGAYIIPFRIEDIMPSKSMEYFLSSQHWLDALTPPLEAHMEQLADTVGQLVRGGSSQSGRDTSSRTPKKNRPDPEHVRRSRVPLIAGVSLVLTIALALVLYKVLKPASPSANKADGGKGGPAAAAGVAPKSGAEVPQTIPMRPAEKKILEALDKTLDADFVELPLYEVAEFVEDKFGINVELDTLGFEELALFDDEPINFEKKGLKLRSCLNLMLNQLELAFVVKNEVLWVTSKERRKKSPDEFHPTPVDQISGPRPEKLMAALEKIVSEDMLDVPLKDACEYFSVHYELPVVIDKDALLAEGMLDDGPINLKVDNISLRSVVHLICEQLGLTYVIRDEVLYITSAAAQKNAPLN